AADVHDEHHRVAPLDTRVELAQRIDDRRGHQSPVEQGKRAPGHDAAQSITCSTMGPSASAGTKVSAPTSSTVPMSSTTKFGPWVGMAPSDTGTRFFAASEPATASIATIGQKRPNHMVSPSATL